jgi:hypothetical protein
MYLDSLMPPHQENPDIAQQLYPWMKRPGMPSMFPAASSAPPAAPAAPPDAHPAVVSPSAPAAAPIGAGAAPGMAPVTLGPTAATAPSSPPGAPNNPTLQPVTLGPAAQPRPTPAADALAASKPPELHGAKKVLDIIGQTYMPRLEAAIPGSPGNYREETRPLLEKRATEEDKATTLAVTGAKDASEIARNDAEAAKARKPDDLKIVYADAVQDAIKRGVDPRSDERVLQLADTITALQKETAPKELSQEDRNTREYIDANKADFKPDASGNYYIASNMAKARPLVKAADRPPESEPHQLVSVPQADGTSKVVEAKPGSTLPKGAQTISEFGKSGTPTADEQRRADLSENMNENLNQLEEIVKRRSDLFGPLAGRATTARSWIGTGDPDIAAIETIKHQIGMAQLGAHSMRSAQGVEKAAEAILNSFKNKPDAVLKSIEEARNSVKTFTGDVQRKGGDAGPKDLGPANGKPEGSTGKLPDGTKVIVKGGRVVPQ